MRFTRFANARKQSSTHTAQFKALGLVEDSDEGDSGRPNPTELVAPKMIGWRRFGKRRTPTNNHHLPVLSHSPVLSTTLSIFS